MVPWPNTEANLTHPSIVLLAILTTGCTRTDAPDVFIPDSADAADTAIDLASAPDYRPASSPWSSSLDRLAPEQACPTPQCELPDEQRFTVFPGGDWTAIEGGVQDFNGGIIPQDDKYTLIQRSLPSSVLSSKIVGIEARWEGSGDFPDEEGKVSLWRLPDDGSHAYVLHRMAFGRDSNFRPDCGQVDDTCGHGAPSCDGQTDECYADVGNWECCPYSDEPETAHVSGMPEHHAGDIRVDVTWTTAIQRGHRDPGTLKSIEIVYIP